MSSMGMRDGMQLLFCVILWAAAFLAALGILSGQIRSRQVFPMAAAVLFGIFACIGGMLFLLFQMTGEPDVPLFALLMLLSLAVFGGEIYFFLCHFRELNRGACILLVTYVLAVFLVTLLLRQRGSNHTLQAGILSGAGEAMQRHSLKPLWHFGQNAALFVPLGVLFPMLHGRFARWGYAAFNGMMLSVWIETIQMMMASGESDVNDIVANTLGAAAGYGIFWICGGKSR